MSEKRKGAVVCLASFVIAIIFAMVAIGHFVLMPILPDELTPAVIIISLASAGFGVRCLKSGLAE
jgi:hypothetical protein